MQVWILKLGSDTVVVDNFRNAIRHAAAAFFPEKNKRDDARPTVRFPLLADIGAAGSLPHFLRYYNDLNDQLNFVIEEHQTGRPPGNPSIIRRIDCRETPDLSYCLQRTIWDLATAREKRTPEVVAMALENEARKILTELRTRLSDDECLDLLHDLRTRFDGPDIIPQFGSATRVLDLIPTKCRSAFIEVSSALADTA